MEPATRPTKVALFEHLEQTMSRGPYPIVLILAMSLPGAARALGLGDIHVDSALNEPLSAQIDIVGATRDELIALTANVANREIFQRYGADRPAFLSSATFKVGLNAQGHPVLNIRSTDAFTDPLISFLVDLRWGRNEVVREYSLLLDPAGFASPRRSPEIEVASASPALPAAALSRAAIVPAAPAAAEDQQTVDRPTEIRTAAATHRAEPGATPTGHMRHNITAGDTLRGIARRAGARSESHIQRMMIAIFRANPNAFEANINRMHRGAVLILPTATELSAISSADAKREVRAQMTAWRLDGRQGTPHQVAATPVAPAAPAAKLGPTAEPSRVAKDEESVNASLNTRVQTLERALDDMNKQLAGENAKIQDLKQIKPHAATESAELVHVPIVAVPHDQQVSNSIGASPLPTTNKAVFGPIAVALGLLLAGFAYIRRRLARSSATPRTTVAAADQQDDTLDNARSTGAPTDAMPGKATATSAVASAPSETGKIDAAPASRLDPPQRIETPIPAPSKTNRKANDETTVSLEIDVEALERSYLDSLGIDAAGGEPPGSETTTLDTVDVDTSELHTAIMKADLDTKVIDTRKPDTAAVNHTNLDYNLLDLDATAQHVHMPSGLHDHAVVHERRTNIVDVLKNAIERDPLRRDLRMKLLETYYSAASINQRGFVDIVRKLSTEREYLSAADWQKVMQMGREIAPDDVLFADASKDDETLSNCA
jgi:pilus assembly protein FimV